MAELYTGQQCAGNQKTDLLYKTMIGFTARTYTEQNDRVINGIKKPNEDYLISDDKAGIFIVADGITRPHSEYAAGKENEAYEVTEIFCSSVYKILKSEIPHCTEKAEAEKALMKAFEYGNSAVAEVNAGWLPHDTDNILYKPAAVALFGAITGDTLCFAYIGDCIGILIRDKCRYVFAERQTFYVNKLALDKKLAYSEYVNNPLNKRSYGIVNGDPGARELTVCSGFSLEHGDKVILSTDGLASMLLYERPETLGRPDLTDIIKTVSAEYDRPPYSAYADDKALIDIAVK